MSDANTQTETRPHVQAASSRSGTSLSAEAMQWVESIARLTQPQIVHWCTGSKDESDRLRELMIRDGSLLPLNEQTHPGSFCARSDVNDVARVEGRTFICSRNESDAGPSNNWSDPVYMREFLSRLFDGCMRGRVMYVIPYLLGPPGSPLAQVGIEVTDSPYVVASMCVMTRVGRDAIDEFSRQSSFVRGLHSTGNLDPEQRYICHFPDENLIMSFSSNYGGNALLAKKCHALRLASVSARREGWLAEHMMVLGVTSPDGVTTYIAGAFPSSCGKTNLAMLVPPEADQQAGWKIETLGDDIAWLHSGPDGKLYAINPEAGFFGVAPGTSRATNPNALAALREDVLFTNVAVRQDGTVWWEGLDGEVPAACTDWTGQPWTPDSGRPAAHPNSRFTVSASQCPCISPEFDNPAGVPISAIVFGGRRSTTMPLAFEAFNWQHGTYLGATLTSEKTAAASGKVGQLRFDPMAMLPFCGYHMADYWGHWLEMGRRGGSQMPRIFHVNWFRKDWAGRYLWPGYRENMRVLKWIVDRVRQRGAGVTTPLGVMPTPQSLGINQLDCDPQTVHELLAVKPAEWYNELDRREEFLARFADRLPQELLAENEALRQRIRDAELKGNL